MSPRGLHPSPVLSTSLQLPSMPESTSNGSSKTMGTFVAMSTIEDLSYTPTSQEQERDAAQMVLTGRKSWKTIKGKGEAVWPAHLEAVLFEALGKYQRNNMKSGKFAGRFPMRNKFISDYIYGVTGKRRTARQVGSRLQQLRETVGRRQLLDIAFGTQPHETQADALQSESSVEQSSPRSSGSASSHLSDNEDSEDGLDREGSSSFSYSPPLDVVWTPQKGSTKTHSIPDHASAHQNNVIFIDILHPTSVYESMTDKSLPCGEDRPDYNWTNTFPILNTPINCLQDSTIASLGPRPLRTIDPSVIFKSATPVCACSVFTVFGCAGVSEHSEVTTFEYCPSFSHEGSYLYRTALVPRFWETICKSNDPTRYVIKQDVVRVNPRFASQIISSDPAPLAQSDMGEIISSSQYRFRYAFPPALASPSSTQSSIVPESLNFNYDEDSSPFYSACSSIGSYALGSFPPLYQPPTPSLDSNSFPGTAESEYQLRVSTSVPPTSGVGFGASGRLPDIYYRHSELLAGDEQCLSFPSYLI